MTQRILDFRSDTVTKPTPGMRAAMAAAAVGDDVFAEDPTVVALETRIATLLGKEAALFVPSGTMSNFIGLRLHCGAGDEFICEAGCHIFNNEQSGYAQLGGLAVRPVVGKEGILVVEQLEGLIRRHGDHEAHTRLVCLENTHNRAGGRILPFEGTKAICDWAHHNGLHTHLDGARLFNAIVATGISAHEWGALFDTVSVCFSKGLGAPVGSAIVGTHEHIARARRLRKVLGGGMRQAGIIAAGALYALDHHIERLAEDHANAQRLAELIASVAGLKLVPPQIDTNIVYFEVDARRDDAAKFAARLAAKGLLMLPVSKNQIRAITHLDVDREAVEQAGQVIAAVS
jgi:threonine aldolase